MEPQQNQGTPVNNPLGTSTNNGYANINNHNQSTQGSPSHKKIGPIIAILVVAIIIITAGIYLFASNVGKQIPIPVDANPSLSPVDSTETATDNSPAGAMPVTQPVTNTSDDLQSLQDDLDQAVVNTGAEDF